MAEPSVGRILSYVQSETRQAAAGLAGVDAAQGQRAARGQTIQWNPATGSYVQSTETIAGGGQWYGGVYFPNDVVTVATQQPNSSAAAAVATLAAAAAVNLAVNPTPPTTIVSTQPPADGSSKAGIPTAQVYAAETPPSSTVNPAANVPAAQVPKAAQTNVPAPGEPLPPLTKAAGPQMPGTVTFMPAAVKTNHPTTAYLGVTVITPTGPAIGAQVVLVTPAGGSTPYAVTVGTDPFPGGATIRDIVPGIYVVRVSLAGYQSIESGQLQLFADEIYNFAVELQSALGALHVTATNARRPVEDASIGLTMGSDSRTGSTREDGTATFDGLAPGEWSLEAQKTGLGQVGGAVTIRASVTTRVELRFDDQGGGNVVTPSSRNFVPLLVGAAAVAGIYFVAQSERDRYGGSAQAQRYLTEDEKRQLRRERRGVGTRGDAPVRVSAKGLSPEQPGRVHVLFTTPAGDLVGYYMSKATYDAVPLSAAATPDDYRAHGSIESAPAEYAQAQRAAGGRQVVVGEPYNRRRYGGRGGGTYYSRSVVVDGRPGTWEGWAADWAAALRLLRQGAEQQIGSIYWDDRPSAADAHRLPRQRTPIGDLAEVQDAVIAVKRPDGWWLEDEQHGPVSGPYTSKGKADGAKRALRLGRAQHVEPIMTLARPVTESYGFLTRMRESPIGFDARKWSETIRTAIAIAHVDGVRQLDVPQLAEAMNYVIHSGSAAAAAREAARMAAEDRAMAVQAARTRRIAGIVPNVSLRELEESDRRALLAGFGGDEAARRRLAGTLWLDTARVA